MANNPCEEALRTIRKLRGEESNPRTDKQLRALFDKNGDFTVMHFDPYRDGYFISSTPDENAIYWLKLFTSDEEEFCNQGELREDVYEFLGNNLHKFPVDSDAVQLYYAQKFAGNTKNNYTAIYMWR